MASSASISLRPSDFSLASVIETNLRRKALNECANELKRLENENEQKSIAQALVYLQKINSAELKLEWSKGSQSDLEKINHLRKLLATAQASAEDNSDQYSKEFSHSIDAVLVVLTRFWPKYLDFKADKFESISSVPIDDANMILTISGIQLTKKDLIFIIKNEFKHPILADVKFDQRDIDFLFQQAEKHRIPFKYSKLSPSAKFTIYNQSLQNSSAYATIAAATVTIARFFLIMHGVLTDPSRERKSYNEATMIMLAILILGVMHGHLNGNTLVKSAEKAHAESQLRRYKSRGEDNPRIDLLLSTILNPQKKAANAMQKRNHSHNVVTNSLPPINAAATEKTQQKTRGITVSKINVRSTVTTQEMKGNSGTSSHTTATTKDNIRKRR